MYCYIKTLSLLIEKVLYMLLFSVENKRRFLIRQTYIRNINNLLRKTMCKEWKLLSYLRKPHLGSYTNPQKEISSYTNTC